MKEVLGYKTSCDECKCKVCDLAKMDTCGNCITCRNNNDYVARCTDIVISKVKLDEEIRQSRLRAGIVIHEDIERNHKSAMQQYKEKVDKAREMREKNDAEIRKAFPDQVKREESKMLPGCYNPSDFDSSCLNDKGYKCDTCHWRTADKKKKSDLPDYSNTKPLCFGQYDSDDDVCNSLIKSCIRRESCMTEKARVAAETLAKTLGNNIISSPHIDEFREIIKPIHEWLKKYYDIHTTIIIDGDGAKVVQDKLFLNAHNKD